MKIKFNKTYFILTLLLFITELCILYTKGFIRHTFGDFLVVIFLYCFLKSFISISYIKAALLILCFSFAIELIQLTSFLTYFNLKDSKIAKTIFGATFSVQDLLAYSLGIGIVILIEYRRK
jgi:hypothetical protein